MNKSLRMDDEPSKNEISQKRHFSFRLNLFFFAVFVLFSALIVRLAYLQFVESDHLTALENMDTETTTLLPPIRGNIYDRNGYAIAYDEAMQSLYYRVEPGENKKDVIALALKLGEVFKQLDDSKYVMTPEEIIKSMDVGYDINGNKTPDPSYYSQPRLIKTGLSEKEIAYFSEHRDDFKGIDIEEESIRKYNEKKIAVQLVGYLRNFSTARSSVNGLEYYQGVYKDQSTLMQTDPTKLDQRKEYLDNEDVGFDGLEFMYQSELRGQNGVKTFSVNAMHKIIGQENVIPPTKGNNLYLTIDKDVQFAAQNAITQHLEEIRNSQQAFVKAPDATTGYAVAMEVNTGRIIAMASMPDYDSNDWSGGRISPEAYQRDQYFYRNGTISEVYPPYADKKERDKHPTSLVYMGSTIKPLTVLVGLQEHLITTNSLYNDQGYFSYGKNNSSTIHNYNGEVFGLIKPYQAIQHSSNVFMAAEIGNPLYLKFDNALSIWDSYMKQFGLGALTGSGLPGEITGRRDYEADAKRNSVQSALVRASWGQLGKYTTLQLAQYTAMLANNGKRMKPIFVDKITSTDGNVIQRVQPKVLNEVNYPQEDWDTIQKGMLLVNKGGFDNVDYSVASKTGTSTETLGGKEVDNAVFISYAPADHPVLAVAVVVPEGGFGSQGAAPIARQIFDAYEKYIGFNGVPKNDQAPAADSPSPSPSPTH